MRFLTFVILLFHSISGIAGTRLFLDFTLNDQKALQQLDEALKVGIDLRNTIANLEKANGESDELNLLRKKLTLYEQQMQKTFGLYPGLVYQMVPTSGVIYNLKPVAESEVGKDAEIVSIKNTAGDSVRCIKIKVKYLKSREMVSQFNRAIYTSQTIKAQIADLEKQLKEKPELKGKEDIQSGMKGLKDTLMSIEAKLEELYSVKADGKYIFEPLTGAVYLALSDADLEKLSDLKKARQSKKP